MIGLPFALCLLATVAVSSSTRSGSLLDRFEGTWRAQGTSFTMPMTGAMTWESALGGKFRRISYVLNLRPKDGAAQTFEGTAFYKPASGGGYVATWFDSTGDMHPIAASVTASALISIWGSEATELGRTTYALQGDGSMKITDELFTKDKTWKIFNETLWRRD